MPTEVTATPEGYAERHTSPLTGMLAQAAAWTQREMPRPGMMSGLVEARLLEALIAVGGARSVLEIGTFTGVGTLAMAAALPEGGRVTTLEVDPETAAAARRHFDSSQLGGRIELIVGDALETIATLEGPFDLVYIDAAKSEYPAYYDAVRPKLARSGVIVADNLFRQGRTRDPAATDESTARMREFADRVQADPSVHNVLLTIGDGVMLAWPDPSANE